MDDNFSDINNKIKLAKKRLLTMHYQNKIGHLGGNLSSLDVLMILYHTILTPQDSFILSKGHAAGALYITLWTKGLLSNSDLDTFHRDGTKLAGHPMSGWSPEIPVATGSLGHGFSISLGIALGKYLQNLPGHVYCLTSDGEWQSGSTWEALIFLAHRKLPNITILVDVNGLQGFGNTKEIASMDELYEKIKSFNINVIQIDGHNPAIIHSTLKENNATIILLNTIKGNGISFMENRMEWHYLAMDDRQYQKAITEVDNS